MKFFKKLVEFFKRTKTTVVHYKEKVTQFVAGHKKQIRLLMSIFETIFPAGTGAKKMACVVTNVCYAVGLTEISQDVADFVESKCQEIYDEFKASLN